MVGEGLLGQKAGAEGRRAGGQLEGISQPPFFSRTAHLEMAKPDVGLWFLLVLPLQMSG